jgi:hypothetical protein
MTFIAATYWIKFSAKASALQPTSTWLFSIYTTRDNESLQHV